MENILIKARKEKVILDFRAVCGDKSVITTMKPEGRIRKNVP